MKKITSIFICLAIFVMAFLPSVIVNAEGEQPNLTITASLEKKLSNGYVDLNIVVRNSSDIAYDISEFKIIGNDCFDDKGIQIQKFPAQTPLNIPVTVKYFGDGAKLKLSYKISNKEIIEVIDVSGLSSGKPSDGGSTTTPDTNVKEYDATVYVSKLKTQILQPSKTVPFDFEVSSIGGGYPTNVRVMVEGDGDYANYFSLDTVTGWDDVTLDTAKLRNIRVSPKAKDGAYKLKFNFTYMCNNQAKTYTETATIFVQGSNSNNPYVSATAFDKKEIGKENKSKLTATLVNPTEYSIYDVRIALNTEASKGFTLYENYNPISISSMNPKSNKDTVFSLYIDSSIATGNHPVVFDISYKDYKGNVISNTIAVYAQVTRTPDAEANADDKSGKPRIIVSKYQTNVKEIKAGQPFELDFTLENTSNKKGVSNIKVIVDSDSGKTSAQGGAAAPTGGSSAVFFAAEGSNSFFIEKIGTKKSVSKKIKLMASQDVEPGVYPVIIRLEYDSDNMPQITSEESIAFPVTQQQRLEITGLNIEPTAMAGQPIPVNFQYINKGKSTIYNCSVNIEGDFTIDGGNVYVGNLSAGYNDFFDTTIIPKSEGEQKGAIILKYEDSQGNEKEQRNEFTVNVMPMDQGGIDGGVIDGKIPDGMKIDPKTGELIPVKSGSVIVWVIVGVVLLLVAGAVTFIIIKKKRKAKKELMLDEEN